MGVALTVVLDVLDLLPSGFVVGESALFGLTSVNDSTIVVALAAGVAGMLALETRASSAVGVAISITTIPAAAYLGVAAGNGEARKVWGALAVLGVNVLMLLASGSLTLVIQRSIARRPGGETRPPRRLASRRAVAEGKIPFAQPQAAAFSSVTVWPRRSSWATRRLV
jgi:hypothetical protein